MVSTKKIKYYEAIWDQATLNNRMRLSEITSGTK